MVVCESVPTSVSQKARPSSVAKTSRDRYSRLTWWQMPMPGRHEPGSRRRRPGPSAAAGSAPCCARTRCRRWCRRPTASPERSTMTEWSMTSSTGTSGLTWRGVAAQAGQRVAHGGEVDDAGHAGEVLHEHALGGEGDLVGGVAGALAVALGIGAPAGHGHDVVGRDVRAVLVAQQVLEEDLDGVGQAVDVVAVGERRRRDVEDLVGAVADGQVALAPKVSGCSAVVESGLMDPFCRRCADRPSGCAAGGPSRVARAARGPAGAPTPAFGGNFVTTS